jgi:hypothetical protein
LPRQRKRNDLAFAIAQPSSSFGFGEKMEQDPDAAASAAAAPAPEDAQRVIAPNGHFPRWRFEDMTEMLFEDGPDSDDDGGMYELEANGVAGNRSRLQLLFNTFRAAAAHLENLGDGPIDFLRVPHRTVRGPEEENGPADFGRLVAALGRKEGIRAIRELRFSALKWDELPEEDVERLFGQVLVSHPTIQHLAFYSSVVPVRYLKLLTSVWPAAGSSTPLKKLSFRGAFGHESSQAIADMIGRSVALATLVLRPTANLLDPDDCKLVCEAVSRNTNLQSLSLDVENVRDDTLNQVGASSSLRTLEIYSSGGFSRGSMENFARQLRTNVTLSAVRFDTEMGRDALVRIFRPIEEALETYNFTLTEVFVGRYWHGQDNVAKLLLRNRRLQLVLEHLEPAGLRPRLFGMVSAIPTLLYRSLRRGNVDVLGRHLEGPGGSPGPGSKKRGLSGLAEDD